MGSWPAAEGKPLLRNTLPIKGFDGSACEWYSCFVPLYEYECESCGHRFEMLQKVADSPLTSCVKCEGKVERLLSSPAIQFKGTGWYVTDYARKGQDSSSKSEQDSSSKSESESSDSTPKTTQSEKNRSKSGPAASASSTSKN